MWSLVDGEHLGQRRNRFVGDGASLLCYIQPALLQFGYRTLDQLAPAVRAAIEPGVVKDDVDTVT